MNIKDKKRIIIFSPTKAHSKKEFIGGEKTAPVFQKKAEEIATLLAGSNAEDLMKSLKIKEETAIELLDIYKNFSTQEKISTLSLFNGISFRQLNRENFSQDSLSFAQESLVILSGLYGALRIFDQVSSYRLDFNDKISDQKIFHHWKEDLLCYFASYNQILNLASGEYSDFLEKNFPEKMINISFFRLDKKKIKSSATLKKYRGLLLNYLITEKTFSLEGLREKNNFYLYHKNNEKFLFSLSAKLV